MPTDKQTNDADREKNTLGFNAPSDRTGDKPDRHETPADNDLTVRFDATKESAERAENIDDVEAPSEESLEESLNKEPSDDVPSDEPTEDKSVTEDHEEVGAEKDTYEDELDAAQVAAKAAVPTLYDRLQDLADELVDGRAPLLQKDHVIIHRDDALDLIETLIGYCEEGGVSVDDALIDRLSSDAHQGDTDYMPLRRVKQRARVIIGDATVQAEHILDDARTLAARLLQETEDKIEARYDEAEQEINVRLSSTNEVSAKRLNESRDELISSRQRAVDILNRYMDKAEEDYQGYWERAEKSLIVSLQKSDTAYGKVAETFERELKVIREDIETIDSILEELKLNRPR